jgi:NADPH:quinone reductase-like Zn-dependent oxidoreductase
MGGMRVMLYRRYGGPEVLETADLPVPVPSEGQVLVKVEASSVNPIDWKRGSGALRLLMPATWPLVPGFDVAGTVSALGPGVTTFAVGDRVHARLGDSKGGASAEQAVAGLDVVTRLPAGMSMGEGAALPLAGMTALQGLRDAGALSLTSSTARVLVIGASGGVGHVAVQLAAGAGAQVTGVCSARNVELVRGLGATQVVDYTQPDAFKGVGEFDVVLDCVGSDAAKWLPFVREGGRYVSTVPGPAVLLRSALNVFTGKGVYPVLLKSRAADLAVLDQWFEAGKLKVVIDSRYALAKLGEAWERSRSGRAAGKIVIDV